AARGQFTPQRTGLSTDAQHHTFRRPRCAEQPGTGAGLQSGQAQPLHLLRGGLHAGLRAGHHRGGEAGTAFRRALECPAPESLRLRTAVGSRGSASVLADPEHGGSYGYQNQGDSGEGIQPAVGATAGMSILFLHGAFLLLFEWEWSRSGMDAPALTVKTTPSRRKSNTHR